MRLKYLWCIGLQSDCNPSLLVYDRKRGEEEMKNSRVIVQKHTENKRNWCVVN